MARPRRHLGNLPAEATSFVGRRRQLAEIRQRLATARVLSLVGPAGVGKTRLAIRSATDLARGFRDGAWLVELAEVREPGLVPDAVMAALDLRAQAAAEPLRVVLGHLREKQMLLVIDNCEHLLDAAAELAGHVLAGAPEVRLMMTSREPLSVGGEHVLPIPPLALPPAHGSEPLDRLRQNEAVTLFVERAAAASGNFELTGANSEAVVNLCRRLDGLPLALELAAVRTRTLAVEQILERLTDRFRLLTGGGRAALPRHETLETAIDWSYDLLSEPERVLLGRLYAFAGRYMLADAEEVCADSGARSETLDVLSSLVDKSLVIKEDAGGRAAYRLHETMREYAGRKLRSSGEAETIARRCTEHYVTTFQAASLNARFRLLEWLPWVELEIDNLRAVLRRCIAENDPERGIVLATALGWYWITRATSEGVRWLDELFALGEAEPFTMAWSYFIRGFLGVLQGDWETARPVLRRAIATARAADLPIQLANSLSMSSIAEDLAGQRDAARGLLEEAASVASRLDDTPSRLTVLQARSVRGALDGDGDALRTSATEGVRVSRATGDLYALHMMLLNLGVSALLAGDNAESRRLHQEALGIAFDVDDRIGQFYVLAALAYHASREGRSRVAAQLLGASEAIRLGAGATVPAPLAPFVRMAEDTATAAIGPAKFRAEFEAGKGLSREAAVRLALGQPDTAQPEPQRGPGAALGARQLEVARLVAQGLSNKQIASRLFISERTVDSHVRTILNKLGFNSRAQIAGWIASLD